MSNKGAETRERIIAASERLILQKGFAGTSLSDVLAATNLTKGAFFHHFADKDELGRAVVERYAEHDYALFQRRCLIFLRLFEKYLNALDEPLAGCVFASYAYEAKNFGPETTRFIRERLLLWQRLYEEKFERLIAARPPRFPVTAPELGEMAVTMIEGGLMMGKAFSDKELLPRQLAQLRVYLQLLFGRPGALPADATAPPAG
jgi:TetR/AcrR family transcriptional regulator, transcriptional repressor for nem operon